jgi:acetylornithine deacetylase/succinyl-diaminopimelate desuccinylase-like protein
MQKVTAYLRENQPRFVKELSDYVRFPSVSAQPQHRKDLRACAEWLLRHCKKIGLDARLCPTAGNPIIIAKTPRGKTKHPHFVVYGHYDVQPAEPFELWKTPPFAPRIEGNAMFARGATDNKGQNFAHLKAVEAYLKTGTELPCDLTFVIEGEEEVGSKSLAAFLKKYHAELKCDAVVISDTGIPSLKHPALTYALRGIASLQLTVHGPSRDLHSGIFGGSVKNPAVAIAELLAKVFDKNGKILIPGFYDDVAPLSAYERKQLARLPGSKEAYRKFLGVPQLFGERGFTPDEQRTSRPTFEINGLTSGYQGEGSKTIVPAWARAKITTRLVPHQDPLKIIMAARKFLFKNCSSACRLEIESGHGARPYIVSPTGPQAKAAMRALKSAFGHEPIIMREGGSIPIVNDFKKYLGADTLLLGLGLPDDNAHSPNEKFDLRCFAKGQLLGAHLWQELAR